MGLLYQFPISSDENEYYNEADNRIELRSYGLPNGIDGNH